MPAPRPVRRAEDFYTPPPRLRADAWQHIPPAERVITYMEHKQQRRLPRPGGFVLGAELVARIDAGRWVAQCPDCHSAQVVSPTDPRMWCVECLPDGWTRVRFPADPAAVEAKVSGLPTRARFWWADDDGTAWNRPRPPLTPKQQSRLPAETPRPGPNVPDERRA